MRGVEKIGKMRSEGRIVRRKIFVCDRAGRLTAAFPERASYLKNDVEISCQKRCSARVSVILTRFFENRKNSRPFPNVQRHSAENTALKRLQRVPKTDRSGDLTARKKGLKAN